MARIVPAVGPTSPPRRVKSADRTVGAGAVATAQTVGKSYVEQKYSWFFTTLKLAYLLLSSFIVFVRRLIGAKMQHWKSWIAILLVSLALVSGRAAAASVVYEFTLTPDTLGPNNPFGISSLPAGPFTGSFSFDDALLVSGSDFDDDRLGDILSFELTIGDTTWSFDDLENFRLDISGGALQRFGFLADDGPHAVGTGAGGIAWTAIDEVDGCTIVIGEPVTSAGCMLGSGLVPFERQATVVAEPGALALFGAGIGLALMRRRRTA
jgi:hypothetical protein